MNKKWLWPALILLAPPTFVVAQTAFIYFRYKVPLQKFRFSHNWKRARAQRRAQQEFGEYFELACKQICADMKIGERVFQRAGVLDENGELTPKYRGLDEG